MVKRAWPEGSSNVQAGGRGAEAYTRRLTMREMLKLNRMAPRELRICLQQPGEGQRELEGGRKQSTDTVHRITTGHCAKDHPLILPPAPPPTHTPRTLCPRRCRSAARPRSRASRAALPGCRLSRPPLWPSRPGSWRRRSWRCQQSLLGGEGREGRWAGLLREGQVKRQLCQRKGRPGLLWPRQQAWRLR